MTPLIKDSVVRLLSEHPEGVLQSRIHKVLGVSKSRVSEVLRELEIAGIITRVKLGNQYLIRLSGVNTPQRPNSKILRLGVIWSTEYVFITPFAKNLKEVLGFEIEVITYPNALAATRALINGEVDLALTPLITQLYAYALTKSLKIIGGGAYGGALIMYNPNTLADTVASSELSTMDLCRFLAIKEGIIESDTTKYFNKPADVRQLVLGREVKYIVVWHPLTEELLKLGLKVITSCNELELEHCCTLAANVSVDRELRAKISQLYANSLEEFNRDPSRWIEWYSTRVGVDPSIVARGVEQYRLNPYIGKEDVMKLMIRACIPLPHHTSVTEVIELTY